MEAFVRYGGGVRFEAEARGHRIVSAQPLESGGEDAGMTPPELLLASLGTCVGYYAAQYLRVHKLPVEDLTVRVEAEKAAHPARLGTFRIEVESPAATEERHREGLLRAAHKCLIHNTLMVAPAIEIAVAVPDPAGVA